ncbi:MAG TPA: RNA polymerase sigma factor [Thermomicrobiales bacterium]|nr:RNA polymerase sigma factor [Thermomicrobiales bacterium]
MRATAERAIDDQIAAVYTEESRRVYATLVRLLGDLDLAEDALQDAFAAALQQWPRDGIPANPRAWLVSTGRFKAIDQIRRRARFDASLPTLAEGQDQVTDEYATVEDEGIEDDRLRLIFTCCHPALNAEARVALTLREVCGLTTEEIARSFLATPTTLAQRIVRAKAKIRDAGIPYRVPEQHELADRLDTVLQVIYLVYTEGYAPSAGEQLTRSDMSGEAIRLARLVLHLLPEPEVQGLLALMLLHESRRTARSTDSGDLILLEDQDRSRWHAGLILEGQQLVVTALSSQRFGQYTIQAAISAVHAEAPSFAETDWSELVGLYDILLTLQNSPVVELNRAAAVAFRDGPDVGLDLVRQLLAQGELDDYAPAWSALADLEMRTADWAAARQAYERALDLTRQEPERRFIAQRLTQIQAQLVVQN